MLDLRLGIRAKMLRPNICSWIKKSNEGFRGCGNRAEVVPFVSITRLTSQGEILRNSFAAMLETADVIDLASKISVNDRDAAVFASIFRPRRHLISNFLANVPAHSAAYFRA